MYVEVIAPLRGEDRPYGFLCSLSWERAMQGSKGQKTLSMRRSITRRCVLDIDYAGTYLRRVVLNQPQ